LALSDLALSEESEVWNDLWPTFDVEEFPLQIHPDFPYCIVSASVLGSLLLFH
jgi:hypothetical protein